MTTKFFKTMNAMWKPVHLLVYSMMFSTIQANINRETLLHGNLTIREEMHDGSSCYLSEEKRNMGFFLEKQQFDKEYTLFYGSRENQSHHAWDHGWTYEAAKDLVFYTQENLPERFQEYRNGVAKLCDLKRIMEDNRKGVIRKFSLGVSDIETLAYTMGKLGSSALPNFYIFTFEGLPVRKCVKAFHDAGTCWGLPKGWHRVDNVKRGTVKYSDPNKELKKCRPRSKIYNMLVGESFSERDGGKRTKEEEKHQIPLTLKALNAHDLKMGELEPNNTCDIHPVVYNRFVNGMKSLWQKKFKYITLHPQPWRNDPRIRRRPRSR